MVTPTEKLQVVVYSADGRSVGLIVPRILDVVEEEYQIQHRSNRLGVVGSAVIQSRVTELLDVPALLRSAGRGDRGAGSEARG